LTCRPLLPLLAALMMSSVAIAAPVTLPDGTRIEDSKVGSGTPAQAGQTVTVHYTGWLYLDGKRGPKFDSSRDGGQPFSFVLGAGEVITGWDEGVVGMKPGGTRTLILPPEAGYGAEGDDVIPPNSWLIFDVELLKAE